MIEGERPATLHYIESSGLVASLLEGDAAATEFLDAEVRTLASALTLAEAARAVVRARVGGRLTPVQESAALYALSVFERRCAVIAISRDVLRRVALTFPAEPVRTLDAIHLITAQMLGEPPALVRILTRDRRIRANAVALGFQVA